MSEVPRFPFEYDIWGLNDLELISEEKAITPPSEDRHLDDIYPFRKDRPPKYE